MELNDLRREWQQVEPVASPVLTSQALNRLQKRRVAGPVEKMRLAARLETGFTVLLTAGLLLALPSVHNALNISYLVLSLVMAAILLVCYYRMLSTLQRMLEPTNSVQEHLSALARGLRQLLQFYYRFTVAAGPCSLLFIFGYYVGHELARPAPVNWQFLGWLALALGIFGALVQVGIVYLTRWYVQRLYGRHLDRLESQLRELREDEPTV